MSVCWHIRYIHICLRDELNFFFRGSVIAKVIGENVLNHTEFDNEVKMWVYEEIIDTQKLTDIINTQHENVKYLPGIKIPENVKAISDLLETCKEASILVFVVPHQFVKGICNELLGNLRKDTKAISLIKGMDTCSMGMTLISDTIRSILNLDVSVLMGANIASEVAQEQFCETTIGYRSEENARILKKLFHKPYFRVSCVNDVAGVEICGALKNVIALGAGFVDGLQMGDNTKAAIIRIGLMEMMKFAQTCYEGVRIQTFFESCGVADLITTCYGGRNRKVAEAMVLTGKSLDVLEEEMLNGQKLQGTSAAKEIYRYIEAKNLIQEFPLLVTIYKISFEDLHPSHIVKNI
ncbi:Glycerol-3-phosphate dehydrogenase [Coelomomyces lativittatus]|nr:Glycerol-3-phosphate dehydrogenase [Coelomomyces lativittatus]